MKIIKHISEIRDYVEASKKQGKKVGLVPTMGFFHGGHLELMKQAGKHCDTVVVSVFVNPIQFGPGEDFKEYPRDLERDAALAEKVGVDVIFAPQVEEMYPEDFSTYVEVEGLTDKLCGKSRPGHFKGVTTIVLKLFNAVKPHAAYFGQKDYQQFLVISKLAKDLNLDIQVKSVPIVREKDGLAMSSRNIYLTKKERIAATVLYRSTQVIKDKVAKGERDVEKLKGAAVNYIKSEPLAEIDYVEILSLPDLKESRQLTGKMLYALAVKIGKARLIDNTVLEVE